LNCGDRLMPLEFWGMALVAGCLLGALAGEVVRCVPAWLEARWAQQVLAAQQEPAPSPGAAARPHRGWRDAVLAVAAGALALACLWRFGMTPRAPASLIFCVVLLTLAWIDFETGLLPDVLTLPLLWLGLLLNAAGVFVSPGLAIWGAALGYGIPWLAAMGYRAATGREGVGYGDFKLLAAMGAWMGAAAIPLILLLATALLILVAAALRLAGRLRSGELQAFGPYLAVVGMASLFVHGAGA
jgi:leader peptidase (prepilin peptidase)/N-methyltransferase